MTVRWSKDDFKMIARSFVNAEPEVLNLMIRISSFRKKGLTFFF